MNTREYIQYLAGYFKACKIKSDITYGAGYIYAYGNILLISDPMCSAYYLIELEYPTDILYCNTVKDIITDENVEPVLYSHHVFNIMNQALNVIKNPNLIFSKIETGEDSYMPVKASENASKNIYFFTDDPVKQVICFDFYNMVPLAKSDSYEVFIANDTYGQIQNTAILKYVVHKKKPKIDIEIYRRVINLNNV